MLFLRGDVALHKGSCLYFFIELNCFLFPWFSFFSHVYCHSTLCLSCLCQYVTKRGRNKWNVGILFVLFRGSWNCFWKGKNIFDVSNLGGELEFIFVFIFYFILFFICLSFHTCVDVFFRVFSGKTSTFWSRPSTPSCNF